MRQLIFLSISIFLLNSCVELPNLIPNGSGEDSDMEIIEINELIPYTGSMYINDDLTLNFQEELEEGNCSRWYLTFENGNILTQSNFHPIELKEGDLVGGFVEGYWKNKCYTRYNLPIFPYCVSVPTFTFEEDVVIGIRFNINGKLHYGWMVLYSDEASEITLKAVGYNKQPGTNVRIGG